jgi:hypothetical protein
MKNKQSILTEVLSIRVSKEEKDMVRELQDKYYFDIFQFMRDTIREEYKSRNENKK